MKILITGGAGFIASNIADGYLHQGHQVVVIDDLSAGKEVNLPQGVKFHHESILGPRLREIVESERPDVVNHHAAQIDVRKSVDDPANDAQINIIGTLNLLEACRQIPIKKIIFASSGGAIYGEQEYFPADEKHPVKPRSPYGIAKLTVEKYLQFYHWTYGLPFVVLRYANVYGPRQNAKGEAGVVAIFTERLLRKESPIIYGDGTQTRDYVYIDDVIACNLEALRPKVQGIFNVGTGAETSVNEIARELLKLTKNHLIPQYAPAKVGEQRRSCLKPGALQKISLVPLVKGLQKTVEWFRQASLSNKESVKIRTPQFSKLNEEMQDE